jgi:adenylate kinase family enzyme
MSARVVLIGAEGTGQGEQLAEAIRANHVIAPAGGAEMERALAATTDGFVLEGYPLNVTQAERLDAFLDARAASIEIALWFRADAAPTPAEDELLSHYRGRVVEVDAAGASSEAELLERALDGIREAALSLS